MRYEPNPARACLLLSAFLFLPIVSGWRASCALILSGNENKIDLTSGAPRVLRDAPADSISILDFSTFPPRVEHVSGVANSVVGPPSNIAITPDGRLALIANSLKVEPTLQTNWIPENFVHLFDLTAKPPRVTGRVTAGVQPSGISIRRDGKLALVANRGDGSISVLALDGQRATALRSVTICSAADSVSDVAIAPDGKLVLASVQKAGYVAVLRLEGNVLAATGQKLSVYGQPYRCVITPDGELGLTAGQGFGNGLDQDALTVIDLKARPMRSTGYVPLGAVPESFEINADGSLLAAVLMNGSNLPSGDPNYSKHGELALLRREGKTYRLVERHQVGRIPEGVAFTSDGKYLVVQCHSDRELWVFAVKGGRAKDTGFRIKVPGMPSSLRASP